jgi:hypothetical protein
MDLPFSGRFKIKEYFSITGRLQPQTQTPFKLLINLCFSADTDSITYLLKKGPTASKKFKKFIA